MTGTLNATQRTLAILWLRQSATADQIADDPRWGGRWPGREQVWTVLILLVETGKAIVDENDVYQVHARGEVEALACASVLAMDPAVGWIGGDGGLE